MPRVTGNTGLQEHGRRINWPDIPTVNLATPIPFLPGGRGPITYNVPAVACGPEAEKVVVELKERAKREAAASSSEGSES
jgi:hypothetical protein